MKPIKLTQSTIAKAEKDILNQLHNARLQGTKISLDYDFATALKDQIKKEEIKTPIVYMLANTYLKMLSYVLNCSTEIAWHGTVKRGEGDKKHIFFIKDVYLYPQKISAATVQVDDDKYTKWSDEQDTETFNNRRFQGHSHVNMSTNYSSVDESNKKEFLQDLLEDDYYIFLVTNKSQNHNFEIYDMAQNIIFEKEDIDFRVYLDENTLLDSINEDINKYCIKPIYETPTYTGYYNSYGGFRNEYDYNSQTTPTFTKPKQKGSAILLNRIGRNFQKEHPELEGEVMKIKIQNKEQMAFIPYETLDYIDIINLQKEGWKVKEINMPKSINTYSTKEEI